MDVPFSLVSDIVCFPWQFIDMEHCNNRARLCAFFSNLSVAFVIFIIVSFLTDLGEISTYDDSTGLLVIMYGVFMLPFYITALVAALTNTFFLIKERDFDHLIAFMVTGGWMIMIFCTRVPAWLCNEYAWYIVCGKTLVFILLGLGLLYCEKMKYHKLLLFPVLGGIAALCAGVTASIPEFSLYAIMSLYYVVLALILCGRIAYCQMRACENR